MTAPDRLPLILTSDPAMLDDLLALAAAAGVEVVVADAPAAALPRWASASLVVVAEDALEDLVAAGMPRRDGIFVVAREVLAEPVPGGRRREPQPGFATGGSDLSPWRHAVSLGAAEVIEVPEGRARLIELLGDTVDGRLVSGPVVSVVSGRGGAGGSTFACALALSAEDCLLIDADPLGGGLDLRVGAEDVRGLRWPELGATRGRVSPLALRDALPRHESVSLVAASRDGAAPVPLDSLAAVLEAGSRGYPLTVVDCPRHLDDEGRYAWGRSRTAIVVVPDDVPGVVASSILLDAMRSCVADIRVVVRRTRDSALTEADVSSALGHPVLGSVPHDRALARGEPVTSAGKPLRRFAQQALAECVGARIGGRSASRRAAGVAPWRTRASAGPRRSAS